MAATSIEIFDKSNGQQEYTYMGRSLKDKKLVIGYVVVEKPWYSNERDWTYYIFQNEYGGGGMCGGAVDLGFKKIEVDKKTIEPFNQISSIKFNQSLGMNTSLENRNGEVVANISPKDKIPYQLWN